MKFENVKPGMVLYDRHREKMGNTTMSRWGEWTVRVIEVDLTNRRALVSWNGNKPAWKTAHQIERYRSKPYAPRKPKTP